MAAVSAAQQEPEAAVTVVTKDRLPYRRPGIPALIAGNITGPERACIFGGEILGRYHIKLICPAEVTQIDTKDRTVSFYSWDKKDRVSYDALVLATGGHPLIPNIAGVDKRGVCTFTTYEGAAEIVEEARSAASAVVVGAGFIALEIAEALMHKGLRVYFNVRSRVLRKLLEPDLSELVSKKLEQQGLRMLTAESISEIGGGVHVEYVVHRGKKIAADFVVMGAGVKPNVALAEKFGIELGATGAIRVDSSMETSVEGIYAAGDCAESPDLGSGRFVYSPVGSIGACAGRIAGRNAAGGKLESAGFLRAQADEIFGVQVFTLGHSTTTAKEVGLKVSVHKLVAPKTNGGRARASGFEAARILVDGKDRIVGAQLISRRHGAQFACQLYQAVINSEGREQFLARFHWPRAKMAKALLNAAEATIVVQGAGQGKALALADRVGEEV